MNDIWKVTTPHTDKTKAIIIDSGGNGRGGWLPLAVAQEIVDAHNLGNDSEAIVRFDAELRDFLQRSIPSLINKDDEKTVSNYWSLIGLMQALAVALLRHAAATSFVELRHDFKEPEPTINH